jgi:predicted nuclease of restriction endonuclease-like (RecB) superfamily
LHEPQIFRRVREILDAARSAAARSVNTAQVVANWLIGREIVEHDQSGEARAKYGSELLNELAARLTKEFGPGYSVDNLELFRRFYLEYPRLAPPPNSDAVRRNSKKKAVISVTYPIENAAKWEPGLLSTSLSWTHYRRLLRIDNPLTRNFYEIEAITNQWSARELDRQVSSLLFERLAKSRDKKRVIDLAKKGQVVTGPADIFKDPVVIEFLGLPSYSALLESELEAALLSHLQSFLLELGKGFAFVARQQRLTLNGDHFYIDLVFYHTILKCYVLIELIIGKLSHNDLGQLQLYVNFYDAERRTQGDNPTIGLILCSDKNDSVVKYTLGPGQTDKIFASRYQLHLPSEAELEAQLRHELRELEGEVDA